MLIIDLDNFKNFNDIQTHSAGDSSIIQIGQAAQSRLRETDVVARLAAMSSLSWLPGRTPSPRSWSRRRYWRSSARKPPPPQMTSTIS